MRFFFGLRWLITRIRWIVCGQCYKSQKGVSTEKIQKLFYCMKFNDQVERIEILMEHAKLYKCFGKTGNLTNLNDQRSLTTVIGRCARNNSISPIANQYSRWFFFRNENSRWKTNQEKKKKEEEYVIYLSIQSNRKKNCWRKKKLASTVIPFVCIALSIIVFRLV